MEPNRTLADTLGPVQPCARLLAEQMDLDANADYVTDHLMEIIFPERRTDEPFRQLLRQDAYDNLDTMWRIIAGRDELKAPAPFGALAFSDAAAQIGIPLSQFERIYRVGVGLVWSLWYSAAVTFAAAQRVPLEDLIGAPSMILHSYIDGQMNAMLTRYETMQSEHVRTREQLQHSVLRQALDGTPALGEHEIEAALGIQLNGEHLALALHTDRDPSQSGLLSLLQRAVPGARILHFRHGVRLWLVWISHSQAISPASAAQLREALQRANQRCAVGNPGRGLEGLGETGRDALEAARMQEMLGEDASCVVTFDDLRLEALILSDPPRALRFVRDELRGLDAEDARVDVLRDTARVWLTTGSHVSTAGRLGIHEHTVRNRITQIETLLGRPILKRRTELLVALRLKRMLEHSSHTGHRA